MTTCGNSCSIFNNSHHLLIIKEFKLMARAVSSLSIDVFQDIFLKSLKLASLVEVYLLNL